MVPLCIVEPPHEFIARHFSKELLYNMIFLHDYFRHFITTAVSAFVCL